MNADQYLELLTRDSVGGRGAAAPELRRAIQLTVNAVLSSLHREAGKSYADATWDPAPYGPDPLLMAIRDDMIGSFPAESQETLRSVPIGTVYDFTPNGYAQQVPGGNGAVICVSLLLQTLLHIVNSAVCIAERYADLPPASRIYAYGASKGLQSIDSVKSTRLGTVFVPPPFPPRLSLDGLNKASAVTHLQLSFIIGHEMSHVVLGHISADPRNEEELRQQELAADDSAAGVILKRFAHSPLLSTQKSIELAIGEIGAVFWAGEAILDFTTLGSSEEYTYPDANERFATVIDCWRDRLRMPEISGSDLFMRPYALLSHVAKLIAIDARDAIAFLTDIAGECRALDDYVQELYTLALARDIAKDSGLESISIQIAIYIEDLRKEENITLPMRDGA